MIQKITLLFLLLLNVGTFAQNQSTREPTKATYISKKGVYEITSILAERESHLGQEANHGLDCDDGFGRPIDEGATDIGRPETWGQNGSERTSRPDDHGVHRRG